jgi:hypothetical protein
MILRASLESALYAFLISQDRADGDLWMARSENLQQVKSLFTTNRATQKLKTCDPNLAALAKEAYDGLIDFGAHPNPRSIISHLKVENPDSNGDLPVSLTYLHSTASFEVLRSLIACIENACFTIAVLCHALPDHPAMQACSNRAWELVGDLQRQLVANGLLSPDHLS